MPDLVVIFLTFFRISSKKYRGNVALFNGRPYTFVHVGGRETRTKGGSIENNEEAKVVAKFIDQLRTAAMKKGDKQWDKVSRIRVISFYQAQVLLIARLLENRGMGNVVVSTVDSSQGSEADIVIVSFVRSKGDKVNSVGFLSDDRRLNVAITRGRDETGSHCVL